MTIYPTRKALVSQLYKDKHFERMLYVGVGKARPTDFIALREMADHITVLEIWPPNFKNPKAFSWCDTTVCADIITYDIPPDTYDAIVWWHGPEHVRKETGKRVIERLCNAAPTVWVASPWGVHKQGVSYGNPYEVHLSSWYVADLEELGFTTGVWGRISNRGHLVGWREP